jgi:peptidoglycan/xylan/chitin deacetylase (PgdA/CDA1 family)
VLTFDGGSGAESATEILDALKARRVRTTFFLTAPFIQKYPEIVRRMAAEGHELGNHTATHPHMAPRMQRDPKWTKDRVQAELLEADASLVRLLGRPMDPYWRAPYGEQTAEIRRWAEEIGYRHVGWSEGGDSLDWATPAERKLYRSGGRILDKLRGRLQKPDGGGLIVLMHLGSGRDEEDRPSKGLGAFMDRALREGWSFVSVGDYLRDMGKPAWDPAARMAWLGASGGGARTGGGLHR